MKGPLCVRPPAGRRIGRICHGSAAWSRSLLARLRRQEADAWRLFVSLYTPLVVRWCHRRGLAEADIADVTQEVLRKVVGSLDLFRKEVATDSFRGWLCRITHHE